MLARVIRTRVFLLGALSVISKAARKHEWRPRREYPSYCGYIIRSQIDRNFDFPCQLSLVSRTVVMRTIAARWSCAT